MDSFRSDSDWADLHSLFRKLFDKMADPIMDLFDDTPLFNLDSLPEDAFSQGSSDPVEEALKLALGHVDPPVDPSSDSGVPVLSDPAPLPVPDLAVTPAPPAPLQTPQVAQVSLAQAISIAPAPIQVQTSVPVASGGGASTAVLLSSPLSVPVSGAQVTPQQLSAVAQQTAGQTAPKIVILKGPQGQAQVLQGVAGSSGSPGKVTIARLMTGTPLRPGMSIVSGNTVLNAAQPAQGQVKVGTGVQRLVQTSNGPVKQVLMATLPQAATPVQIPAQAQMQTQVQQLQFQTQTQPAQVQTQVHIQPQNQTPGPAPVPAQTQVQTPAQAQLSPAAGSAATVRPQGVTLSTVPQQVRLSPVYTHNHNCKLKPFTFTLLHHETTRHVYLSERHQTSHQGSPGDLSCTV